MSDIYLSRIHIQDFRTFGHFEIDIPAAPGLLLLTGTNGLGKSSFFDAIEWSLTGKIRRFSQYVEKGKKTPEADYLTRRGAEPGSHEVTLTFSEGNPIERSAARATPHLASIIAQLAHADRPTITDLGTYLALTHFLGQASQQRFTSREPQDQWEALKGPSGIERLEQIRSGLRGRATVSAFSRRIDKEESALKEVEKHIADWQGWQARLNRLRQAARAAGTLTADEVAHGVAVLEAKLFDLLREAAPVIAGETSSQRLARLNQRVAQALQAFTERQATIEGLSERIGQFTTASANARTDHPVLVRARQEVSNAQAALSAATVHAEAADAAEVAQNNALATIEQEIAILEAARSDLTRRGELAAQIGAVESELSSLTTKIAERRTALAGAEAAVREHADRAAEVARLRSLARGARALVVSHSTLLDLEDTVSRNETALASARQAASNAQTNLETLRLQRGLLLGQIDHVRGAQAAAERHASAVSAAVATLASHIDNDDTNCPLCRTPFKPGELKLLADEAARSRDARLAGTTAEIERLRVEASTLDARIGELEVVVDTRAHLERTWQASLDAATAARTALAHELGVDVRDNLAALANAREEKAYWAVAESERQLESHAPLGAASVEQCTSIAAELEELIGRATQVTRRLNALRSEDQGCAERITARGVVAVSIESLNARLSMQRASLEAARSHRAQLATAGATAKFRLDNLRKALVIAERVMTEAEGARANAESAANQLAQDWTRSGLEGLPSQAALDRSLAAVKSNTTAVRFLNDRLQALANDNQSVLLQDEINETVGALLGAGGIAGLADPATYLAKLQSKAAAARAALRLTREARAAVMSYTELLKERAENFSAHVLAPLNGVIDDFNDAMLSTPGESIQFKAEHRVDATSFGMSLRYRELIDNAIEKQKDLPPQLVLSEGQLAANGFSILCAASTAYPWSRWRALLLDDPLQHNDIIHTAAFVDVMRNMVEFKGYQLIMSSHDRGESDFIARKFDAAGLPCSTILLTAPSDKGVVHEGPEHNQAAKRILKKAAGYTQQNIA